MSIHHLLQALHILPRLWDYSRRWRLHHAPKLIHRSGNQILPFASGSYNITCEDAVIGIAKRFGYTTVTPLSRMMGYSYVFVWFSFSATLWLSQIFMPEQQALRYRIPALSCLYGRANGQLLFDNTPIWTDTLIVDFLSLEKVYCL